LNPLLQNDPLSIDKIGLFSHLSPIQRKNIEEIGILRRFEEDEIVFYEGDQSE
jgi:hypothetical protein